MNVLALGQNENPGHFCKDRDHTLSWSDLLIFRQPIQRGEV